MKKSILLTAMIIVIGIFLSGCVSKSPTNVDKKLIPIVSFRIEIYFAEWDIPLTYTFKEGNEVDIRDSYGGTTMGQYKLFRENNTIKLSSKKDDFYGLVLYDNYANELN